MANPLDLLSFARRAWETTQQPLKERGIPGMEPSNNQGLMGLFSLPVLADAFAPVGTYEDGSVGPAWPKVLADPLQRGYDAANTPIPAINDDQGWADKSAAMFDAASLAPIAGLGMTAAGVGTPKNAVGIFGGRLAKTADQAALARAEKMAAEGLPREQIWNDTGWFQGVDGKWRFEIDDSQSALNPQAGKLGNALSHEELYAAYPKMKSVNFKPEGASFGGEWGWFQKPELNAADRSLALHEVQHAAQQIEGFGGGGSDWTSRSTYPQAWENELRKIEKGDYSNPMVQEFLRQRPMRSAPSKTSQRMLADIATYGRIGGEVEARAVQARRDLTPDQRKMRAPWLDYDVPENDLLFSNSKDAALPGLVANALEHPQGILASRDMVQLARSLGYDPQRVRSYAQEKVNELSSSRWASDQSEAARFGQLLQEIDANPNALSAIRQGERSSVQQSQLERQQQRTERPLASRDGYQIVRRDDPYVGAVDFDIIGPGGRSVGNAKMGASQGQVENPEIGWVGIDQAHQRKGLASWLYDEIEKDIGRKLWPSPELISPEIQSFWQKRDPDRLARMKTGTYANAPTGSLPSLTAQTQDETDPALLQVLRQYGML